MHKTTSGLALAALLTASGCTAGGQNAATPSPSGSSYQAKEHQLEHLRATCMKRRGFTYVPWIFPVTEETAEEKKQASGDYTALRAARAKRGWGVYYSMVFKKDEQGKDTTFEDPNGKIVAKLSDTQARAWTKAHSECFAEAAKVVYNKVAKDEADLWRQYWKIHQRALSRELDGDPELTALAGPFGDCLKAKGYKVTSLRPTALNERGRLAVQQEMTALAQKQSGKKEKLEEGAFLMPQLTPAEAREHFDREVKAALDDVDCGKDFYAAFLPKRVKISERVNDEFGLGR